MNARYTNVVNRAKTWFRGEGIADLVWLAVAITIWSLAIGRWIDEAPWALVFTWFGLRMAPRPAIAWAICLGQSTAWPAAWLAHQPLPTPSGADLALSLALAALAMTARNSQPVPADRNTLTA